MDRGESTLTHFAKVAAALEHIVGDVASQLGETDPKKLMKWRHLFRDEVRPLYKKHTETAAPYMSELLDIAVMHSHRIKTVYAKQRESVMERYRHAIEREGSSFIEEGTR
jgi:hypothetical protein